jgi:pimeloyl-ACP methyl ester carboxylesterase
MAVRSYTPSTETRSERLGIVLYNHFGSSVAEDTGRDAQILADASGLAVIAADRPGSGLTYPGQGPALAADYKYAVGRHAVRKILPEVQYLGLRHVAVAGRSAGGLAALMATWSRELPVSAVHVQELIAWHDRTISEGRGVLDVYYMTQGRMQADPNFDIIRPEPTDQTGLRGLRRTVVNAANFLIDRSNNKHVWRRPLAREAALGIAAQLPRIRMDLCFAEYSLVLPEIKAPDQLQKQLREARGDRPGAAPINVEVIPKTTHASFDLRLLSNSLILRTLEGLNA